MGRWITVKDVTWGDTADFLEAHGQALSGWAITALSAWKENGCNPYEAFDGLQEATFNWLTSEGHPLNPDYCLRSLTDEEIAMMPALMQDVYKAFKEV